MVGPFPGAALGGILFRVWTELNREQPARRGLALLLAAIVLAGTTGLAWSLTAARATPTYNSREQYPLNWPFAFTLPSGFSWSPPPESEWVIDTHSDGNGGLVGYFGRSMLGDRASLAILYGFPEAGSSSNSLRQEFNPEGLGDGRPISIGPMEGRVLVSTLPTPLGGRQTHLLAVGSLPVGLAVRIEYLTTSDRAAAMQAFEDLCGSVVLKDWWIEP